MICKKTFLLTAEITAFLKMYTVHGACGQLMSSWSLFLSYQTFFLDFSNFCPHKKGFWKSCTGKMTTYCASSHGLISRAQLFPLLHCRIQRSPHTSQEFFPPDIQWREFFVLFCRCLHQSSGSMVYLERLLAQPLSKNQMTKLCVVVVTMHTYMYIHTDGCRPTPRHAMPVLSPS